MLQRVWRSVVGGPTLTQFVPVYMKELAAKRCVGRDAEGWSLTLPPARSKIKSHPEWVPLNAVAVEALLRPPSTGRVFSRWKDLRSWRAVWNRMLRDAGLWETDLCFHALRHT